MATGAKVNGLRELVGKPNPMEVVNIALNSTKLWHCRMGRLNNDDVRKLSNGMATGIENLTEKRNEACRECQIGKSHRDPIPKTKGEI